MLLWGAIASVAATMLALAQPYLIGTAIDSLKAGKPQQDVVNIALVILGLAAAQGVGELFSRYGINSVSRKVEYELRNDFFAHLQTMPQSFFQEHHTGDIMARATNDMSAVRNAIGPGLSNGVRTGLMFVVASVLMISINLELALVVIFFMPLVSIAFVMIGRKMHQQFESVQAQFGELSTYAQENFSGIRVVKAYAQENFETEYFAKESRIYLPAQPASTSA